MNKFMLLSWLQLVCSLSYTLSQTIPFFTYQLDTSHHSEVLVIGSQSQLIVFFNNGSSFISPQSYSFGYPIISAVDITADGKWIAVAGMTEDQEMKKNKISVFSYCYQNNTYQQFQTFFGDNETGAYAVAISSDHQWLVWGEGYETDSVRVYKNNGSQFNSHQNLSLSGVITSLEFTEDNAYLVIGVISDEVVIYGFNGNGFDFSQSLKFGGQESARRASITGDAEYLVVSHSQKFFVEIYRFNHHSSKFQLVSLNEELFFPSGLIWASQMSAQHDLLVISTSVGFYIYSVDNNTIEQKKMMVKTNYDGKFSWDARQIYNAESGAVKVFTDESFPLCGQFCLNCNDTQCMICNQLLDYFLNSTGQCQLCPIENCVQCLNITYCSKCNSTLDIIDEHSGRCELCTIAHCLECQNSSYCFQCSNHTFFVDGSCLECSLANCLSCANLTFCEQCQDGRFWNVSSGQCQKCSLQGCSDCQNLTHCKQCDSADNYYAYQEKCKSCDKLMLWINETSCCSIVERCHPDFWQFILFLSWLIILIILVSCSIQKYKDDLKEKKEKERQYKIEELDFGNETHIEPNKQEEKVPR